MKKAAPSARMISDLAGVSTSTVSRALSGHRSIPEATRKRILSIARQIGYEPNAMASSLATSRSGVIGFVIGQMENPFYQEQIERVTHFVNETGRQLMLFQVRQDGTLADVVSAMARYRLEGCIVIASVPTSLAGLKACKRHAIPVVLLNRLAEDGLASSVLCNNFAGGQAVARLLLEAGHQNCALLTGRSDSIVNRDRVEGFRAGLAAAGAALCAEACGEFGFDQAYRATTELLARTPRPDAIFAVSDLMALGAMDAVREAGLSAPADISIVGFDGIRAAAWPSYQLTSIVQPIDAMLQRAVDLLGAQAENPEQAPETAYIQGKLVARRSCRLPVEKEDAELDAKRSLSDGG